MINILFLIAQLKCEHSINSVILFLFLGFFFYSMALLSFSKSFHETIKIALFSFITEKNAQGSLRWNENNGLFFWYGERKITFNDNWSESIPKLQFDERREDKTPLWLLKIFLLNNVNILQYLINFNKTDHLVIHGRL